MKVFLVSLSLALLIESFIFYSLGIYFQNQHTPLTSCIKIRLLPSIKRPEKLITKSITPQQKKIKQLNKRKKSKTPKKIVSSVAKVSHLKKLKVLKTHKKVKIKQKKVKKDEYNPYRHIKIKSFTKNKATTIESTPEIPKIIQSKINTTKHIEQTKKTTVNKDERLNYLLKVASLLNRHKNYPRLARKRGIEGNIKVIFKITSSGKTFDIRISNKCNHILRKAVIRLVSRIRLPLPPKNWDSQFQIALPVVFKLN